MTMLLEGLAHLSTMKDDWATRVQMCIAQASKLQFDESIRTPQTDVLLLLLDLACSMHQKTYQISAQKLSALQKRLEELKQSPDWSSQSGEMLLPIHRMQNSQQIVTADTRAVLRPGDDGMDYLVLSTLGKQEAWALAYVSPFPFATRNSDDQADMCSTASWPTTKPPPQAAARACGQRQ